MGTKLQAFSQSISRQQKHLPILLLLALALLLGSIQVASAAPNDLQAVNDLCSANVAEAANYTLVYQLAIPTNSDYGNNGVLYTVDNAATIAQYNRVAYCLELDDQWVWVSMADFTNGVIAQTGVPVRSVTPAGFQQVVETMNVYSNVPDVVTGDNLATGNIEFWQNCYNRQSQVGLSGANDELYDFDDIINNNGVCDGWGSMQVHNHGAGQTLLAYSGWDDAQADAVGIGNNPTDQPDWTFAQNAGNFTSRTLGVFVANTEPIYYVDAAATGSATGASWANAYVHLQDALQVAVRGGQIWVAQGVYYPDLGVGQTDNDTNASFTIPAGVTLYGGFAPNAAVDELGERNWTQYATVLSGDIGQDDTTDANQLVADAGGIGGANSNHVLFLNGRTDSGGPITNTTVIDGFFITAGSAGGGERQPHGGGIYCLGSEGGECSPLLKNVTFSGNAAAEFGGALYNDGYQGASSPTLVNVTFSGNTANSGGALYNGGNKAGISSPTLINVTFSGNAATTNGGAMFNFAPSGTSRPALVNVTFSGNAAMAAGGAIYNQGDFEGEISVALTNVILWQNSAPLGLSIFNENANLAILNSIIQGGADGIATAGASGIAYTGNSESDPLFVQPIDPANAPTSSGDLRLQAGSSAIDIGDNSALPVDSTTDRAGKQRISNRVVDAGAYERQQIVLTLAQPDALPGLIANSEATMQPQVEYNGYDELSFVLTESPAGMVIDLSTGLIRWTPQVADEGQSYTIGVRVNDGNRFAETSFQVTVLAPEPIHVEIEGNLLRVVDESTTLHGMTITQLEGEPMLAELSLGKLTAAAAPATPEWVSLLSDVLVIRGSIDQAVELRFPLDGLPEGVSLGAVDLYAFTEAFHVEGRLWVPAWMAINYEGTTDAPVIAVQLSGLEGMIVWGHEAVEALSSIRPQRVQSQPVAAKIGLAAPIPYQITPTCVQESALGNPIDTYTCTTSAVTVTIKGWGNDSKRWGTDNGGPAQVSKEQLVGWFLDAQAKFTSSGLGFDQQFNVSIHDIESKPGYITLGYVTSTEARKTLHLNSSNAISVAWIKGTAVHEYFHHAQGHPSSKLAGKTLLIDGSRSMLWLIEGTARWFEDEVFDAANAYLTEVGARIPEAGLNSEPGAGTQWEYGRFTFFKLMNQSCPNFTATYKYSVNVDNLQNDPSGLLNLASLLGSGENKLACNFGSHLGTDNAATLSAALAYYNYATQREGKVSLLDANERKADGSDVGFRFDKPDYQFAEWPNTIASWVASPGKVVTLTIPSFIPAAGAYSFNVPAIAGTLPDGKVAQLTVEGSRGITVSITGSSGQFTGTNTIGTGANRAPHAWFTTTQQTGYIYSANGKAPALFVTLINPSLTEKVSNVKVTLRIRDAALPEATITEPQAGAQVANRVITVAGTIPEAARAATKNVVVTINGIAANAPVQPDGTFNAQVIVALGSNSIKIQGFGDGAPTTEEKVITIQGVESASTKRNALIASRAVFVLRWDTDASDVDIYATDKTSGTVWFEPLTAGPGILDYDDTDGFGPEVISYRATDDPIYVDGAFAVDVHYYAGTPATTFTIDVILNETEANNRRIHQYRSVQSLTTANSNQRGPNGQGDSRFNKILRISCSAERICTVAEVDSPHLSSASDATTP